MSCPLVWPKDRLPVVWCDFMRVTCVVACGLRSSSSELKRRRIRQLERQYGPAWRYTAGWTSQLSPVGMFDALEVPVFPSNVAQPRELDHVGCASAPRTTVVLRGLVQNGNPRVKDSQPTSVLDENNAYFNPQHDAGTSSSDDPLFEFLRHDDEHSALLLAMWTSLYRCCVHASELSEFLAFRVRWFLHHLIHMRATAAAVRFYHRLLLLGVHLQKKDVSLLLSSLPYEHYVANVDFKGESKKKCSRFRTMRQADTTHVDKKSATNGDKGGTVVFSGDGGTVGEEERLLFASTITSTGADTSCDTSARVCPAGDTCGVESVDFELTPAGSRYLRDQPEWVKRWVLYEASMGNIDLYGEEKATTLRADKYVDSSSVGLDCGDECTPSEVKWAERCIDVVTLLNHLMLLHDGNHLIHRETRKRRVNGKGRSGITLRGEMQRHYWAEALQIAGAFLSARSSRGRERKAEEGQYEVGCSVPPEFRSELCRALVAAGSWKVALRWLKVAEQYRVGFTHSEYARIFLCLAESEPWETSRAAERFVARNMIPLLPEETVCGYASRAMWLAHVCSQRDNRVEECLELMESTSGNLPACVKQSIVYIKLAASLLRVDADRFFAAAALQQFEAASIRLGVFHPAADLSQRHSPPIQLVTRDMASAGSGALLTVQLQDSFVLVSIALPRVVELVSVAAASQEDEVQLATLLADVLYGPNGLWKFFSDVCLVGESKQLTSHRTSEVVRISLYMSLCLLKIGVALCRVVGHERQGVQGNPHLREKHLTLILGLLEESLGAIPARNAVEIKDRRIMLSLVATSAKLTKHVFRQIGVYPCNEKVIFGSFSEETSETVALMLRIHVLLWRRVSSLRRHLQLAAGSALRAVFRPTSELGKHVRGHIPRHQQQELDSMLAYGRLRKYGERRAGAAIATKPKSEARVHSPEDVARIKAVAKTHRVVYALTLQHVNNGAALERDLITYLSRASWDGALTMLHVSLHHLRLPHGTFGLPFFAGVLARLCKAPHRTKSLWFQAIGVYWDAVEHVPRPHVSANTSHVVDSKSQLRLHERNVLTQLLLPLLRFSVSTRQKEMGWSWMRRWDLMHKSDERDVEYEALSVWARSVLEDRSALNRCQRLMEKYQYQHMRQKNLPMIPPLENILCEVAVNHADWCAALHALETVFWTPQRGGDSITAPLPPQAATAVLRILCKAPTNLCNTARRLREIQGSCWDLRCANSLLLLLVRQRRWQLALQHVAEMLPVVQNGRQKSDVVGGNSVFDMCLEGDGKTELALFLVHGLRACANGGRAEEAATLYDLVKQLTGLEAVVRVADINVESSVTYALKRPEDMLFFMCNQSDQPQDTLACDEDERMRMLVGQARVYFLRAMTKKTLRCNRR